LLIYFEGNFGVENADEKATKEVLIQKKIWINVLNYEALKVFWATTVLKDYQTGVNSEVLITPQSVKSKIFVGLLLQLGL
jgi:hypothetical protein